MMDNETNSRLKLPTAEAVYEDTELPYLYILEVYPFDDIRTLKKHLDELPLPVKTESDISKIINSYERQINMYAKKRSSRSEQTKYRWEKVKAQYEAALAVELKENPDVKKLQMQFDENRKSNQMDLLKRLKPIFYSLDRDQQLKLAYYFYGYTGLFGAFTYYSDLLLACVGIMTKTAKDELKQYIESMEPSRSRPELYILGGTIAWGQKIRCGNGKELKKSPDSAWPTFKMKFTELDIYNDDYIYIGMLGVATLIILLEKLRMTDDDLELIMSCALFLNGEKQAEVLCKAVNMLIPGNIDPSHNMEEVQYILETSKIENILTRLEYQLGIRREEEIFQ